MNISVQQPNMQQTVKAGLAESLGISPKAGFDIVGVDRSVERAFLAMNMIRYKLRNKINDVWFNDLMGCYTELEIFKSLDDIDSIRTFTTKKSQKEHLPYDFI
ncbi:unnamed protein product [Lathyrus sativus]|nr:unnamed protein product [Lathyrus sativus]